MSRRGSSLIEVVVVLWISTLLLLVAVQLLARLHRLTDLDGVHAESVDRRRQLAERFRADAHAAKAAELVEDGKQSGRLVFQLPGDESIEYTIDGAAVSALRRRLGKQGLQTYELGLSAKPKFAIDSSAQPVQVRLIVSDEPPPTPGSTESLPTKTWQVEARVGLNQRFAKGDD